MFAPEGVLVISPCPLIVMFTFSLFFPGARTSRCFGEQADEHYESGFPRPTWTELSPLSMRTKTTLQVQHQPTPRRSYWPFLVSVTVTLLRIFDSLLFRWHENCVSTTAGKWDVVGSPLAISSWSDAASPNNALLAFVFDRRLNTASISTCHIPI